MCSSDLLEKERQAKQDILAQVQLATQREQKVADLQKPLSSLKVFLSVCINGTITIIYYHTALM